MTSKLMPRALMLMAGLALAGPWTAVAAMDLAAYADLLENYYRQPQPEKLPEAFEYFIQSLPETPADRDTLLVIAARTRFFGLLSDQAPGLKSLAASLLNQAGGARKTALLSFFRFGAEEPASASLRQAAAEELDDAQRMAIERILAAPEDPRAILRTLVREENAADHWSAFHALGNTHIVVASLAELTIPLAVQARPASDPPRVKQLRQTLGEQLARHFAHPAVPTAIFEQAETLHPEYGPDLVKRCAEQILYGFSDYPAAAMLPWVQRYFPGGPETLVFQGAAAARERRWDEVQTWVTALAGPAGPWAEMLRGFAASQQHAAAAQAWQVTSIPAGGKPFLESCITALQTLQAVSFHEQARVTDLAGQTPDILLTSVSFAAKPAAGFFVMLRPGFCEARLLLPESQQCWTDRVRKWVSIREHTSASLTERLSNPATLLPLLASMPAAINQVQSPEGDLAAVEYPDMELSNLLPHLLRHIQADHAQGRITLTFGLADHRLQRVSIDADFYKSDRVCGHVALQRVYYDHDQPHPCP